MVIPSSDHTTTSTSRAMVPKNLRVRIVMADMSGSWRVARGKGRTIRGAPIQSSTPWARAQTAFNTGFMTDSSAQQAPHAAAVRWWLIVVAALIAIMVLVGGATRLTESGLSIVEWKPVTGALPPLSETEWTAAFEAYKKIPQFQQMNADMDLSEFKTIFWWEWSHRLLGRFIGAAYLLPFLFFLWRRAVDGELRRRLWSIFALGALQGVVGWWMVASGLSERIEVSQYRLATHLLLALVIFASIVWTLRELAKAPP